MTRAQGERVEATAEARPGGAPEPRAAKGWKYGPLAVFGVIVVLAGTGWLLLQQMMADAKLQDCVMAGRKNCVAPVESGGR
jgi:hypothetical protein